MAYYRENRKQRQGALVVVLAILIFGSIVIIWLTGGFCPASGPSCRLISTPTQTVGPGTPSPLPMPGIITISMFSSDTKEDWIDTVTESFNAKQFKTTLGNTIVVTVTHGNSGDPVEWIPAGILSPTIWSPGEYSWVYDMNDAWEGLYQQPLVTEECRPTVYAPVGFAMFQPMAEAMGWPDKPIGWKDIIELMADPQGWASYDNPQWGQFKFGHTHPDHSNSGLLLLTALAYSTAGKTGDLTLADVRNSRAYIEAMTLVELRTYHYGIKSRDNIIRMIQAGPEFLHATNTSEAETLRANSGIYGKPRFPLVFIFPADGTFWAEQPFCVLEAEWVSDEQREAAWLYYDYLFETEQQALTIQNYLRPIDPGVPLQCPFCVVSGTIPSLTPQTIPALGSVYPDVSGAVKDVFHETKRKLTVVLVLDRSQSMNEGNKIAPAANAAAQLVRDLEADDAIYTYLFNDVVIELLPSGRAGDVKEGLASKLETVFAEESTALYDAVCEAAIRVTALRAEDEAAGQFRLYGIVVLSDGEDTNSVHTENDVFNACLPAGEEAAGIRVFTVAYIDEVDPEATTCPIEDAVQNEHLNFLLRLANQTEGNCYTADPETIEEILRQILVQ